MNQPKRIGIFGGTFDPIHIGHLFPAKQASTLLALNQLRIMPAHIPPHKCSTQANAAHRLAMTKLACADDNTFIVDQRELIRNTPSYTRDTLIELANEFPDSQLFFIMGMDSLQNFTTWYKYQDILNLCHLVVNKRPEYNTASLSQETKDLLNKHIIDISTNSISQNAGNIILLDTEKIPVSSTQLRAKLQQGQSSSQLIPQKVRQYIEQNDLYR